MKYTLPLLVATTLLTGCTTYQPMTPAHVDAYVTGLHKSEPDLRQRVLNAAHRQLGQPYDIYLLGEFPFELDDPQPLFELEKSDCVVFVEHTYAMALGKNWPEFFAYLQRIRYIDGRIGVATRNHYSESQWNVSNDWLVQDVTDDVAGDKAVPFKSKADVAKFLNKNFGKNIDGWTVEIETTYVPHEHFDRITPAIVSGTLRDGDLVQIVRGTPPALKPGDTGNDGRYAGAYVGHFGLLEIDDAGTPWLIHSAEPEVRREKLIDGYAARAIAGNAEKAVAGKPQFLGYKFLVMSDDPADNLRKLDGPDAPIVTFAPNRPLPD